MTARTTRWATVAIAVLSVVVAVTASAFGASGGSSVMGDSTSVPFRGTLVGTADTLGRVTLTRNGKPVRSVKSGRYKIVVTDTVPHSGFIMQRPNSSEIVVTSWEFVGTRRTTLKLTPGRWGFHGAVGVLHQLTVVR